LAREPQAFARAQPLRVELEGAVNFALLVAVVGVVLMSGLWESGVTLDFLGASRSLEGVVRDVLLVVLGLASLALTPRAVRAHNVFHWAPIVEVAKLFAAIFVSIIPVLAILAAGRSGALRCSSSPESFRPSSTTRRPTSCSSISPAATRMR
jgi:hypothetical protein